MLDHMGSHAYPPANRGRLVLWGLLASFPFGGMTWQVLHHLAAMRRLGFDVWYVEDTNRHMRDLRTYEPTRSCAANIEHAVKWLEMIGLEDRFIIREPCTRVFHGGDGDALARLYEEADAVFNLCGAQEHRRLHDVIRCAVYIETDPVEAQVDVAKGRPRALKH